VIQGLTSYLRGNLAYQSMLVGLGVGDVEATATAGESVTDFDIFLLFIAKVYYFFLLFLILDDYF
jgi:hypothetical protein